jgi:hypothetical protein
MNIKNIVVACKLPREEEHRIVSNLVQDSAGVWIAPSDAIEFCKRHDIQDKLFQPLFNLDVHSFTKTVFFEPVMLNTPVKKDVPPALYGEHVDDWFNNAKLKRSIPQKGNQPKSS